MDEIYEAGLESASRYEIKYVLKGKNLIGTGKTN